jgi:hypothetical protein
MAMVCELFLILCPAQAGGSIPTTTFFTAVNRPYEPFVAPYALGVLHYNADAAVEVCVQEPERFALGYAPALAVLTDAFPDRLLIRRGDFADIVPNAVRFLETPELQADYTYIGDADVLILDGAVTTWHLANMARLGLPYSNVCRPGHPDRLSGMHFTRTADHYPLTPPPDARTLHDEHLLWRLVTAKGLGTPEPTEKARPIHGWHLSLQRPPTDRTAGHPKFGWGVHLPYLDAYLALVDSPLWRAALPCFAPAYRVLLAVLDAALQAQHPDRDIYQPPGVKRLFNELAAG